MSRIERQIGVNPDSSLLHIVGQSGVKPADEATLLQQGYQLVELSVKADIATFIYEKE